MPNAKKNVSEPKTNLRAIFWPAAGLLFVLILIFSINSSGIAPGDVKMTLDFGEGKARNFITSVKTGMTAWDMLQQANAIYSIPVQVEGNFKPKAINGKTNGDGGKHWNFYVNQKLNQASPYEIKLSGGESILFKFE